MSIAIECQTAFIQLQVESPVGKATGQPPVIDGTVTPCGLAQPGRDTRGVESNIFN